MAKVADLAGLSAGIVNFYFQTKDALLLATLQHVDGEFERRQTEAARLAGNDPVRLLDAMIEVAFDPDVCNPRWTAVWDAFWGEARAREGYMRVCGRREEAQERQVVELFSAIVEAGEYQHLHPEALGSAFYHLLSSLPEHALETYESFDFEAAKLTCRQFLRSIFPEEFSVAAMSARWARVEIDEKRPGQGIDFETLPTWVYHDPKFHSLEMEHLFRRSWLMVGHANEARQPGDYITLDVADDRVFVIRGRDGKLRAFDNVCRHRASRVVKGEIGSCSNSIVCPFHGWSYGFDGRLGDVPAGQNFPGLEKSKIALPELQLEEWMGFVFVRFTGDGPSVSEQLAPVHDEARLYRFEDMRPWGERTRIDCNFNWKLFIESDSRRHRNPLGRPEPRGTSARSRAVPDDPESTTWSERMYQQLLPEVETLPKELRHVSNYYTVFPTAVLRVSPDLVDCYQVIPFGPDKCRLQSFRVAHDDTRREMRAARYLTSRIARQSVKEDLDFCSWTHSGVRSSRYQGGFLSEQEVGVRRFQDRIRALLSVDQLR